MIKPISEESFQYEVDRSGFAIVPDILPAEAVNKLTVAIESVFKKSGQHEYAMRHLLNAVPDVREVATDTVVRHLVGSIIGLKAFVVRSIFFDKTPEANWKVAWHQDLTIAVKKKIEVDGYSAWSLKEAVIHVQPPVSVLERMITVRLHLDDCGTENGPLQVIPKSHKAGRMNHHQISFWREMHEPVSCIVPRGGALLMRPLLLHSSSGANTPTHRRVVHLEFASDSLPGGLEWDMHA